MKEQPITKIEVTGPIEDLGAAAAKAMPPGRRHRYRQSGFITMEDGTTDSYTFRGLTKPKLQDDIRRTEGYVASRCIKATYDDNGKRWGTCITF
jgi:hypothetical protein